MGVDIARHDRLVAPPGQAAGHQHRFRAGGRAVIERRVGDLGAEKLRHLRLELEQRLKRALRDLGLIGRVGGEEFAPLYHRVHGGRHMVAIGSAADKEGMLARRRVLPGIVAEDPVDLDLALVVGQIERLGEPRGLGHVAEEVVDALGTDGPQHRAAVGVGQRQISHEALAFTPGP